MIFGRQKKTEFADIHCHVVPGVDDGASDMQEALRMLKTAYVAGITHMIVTPHYKEGRRNASPEKICSLIDALQKKATDNGTMSFR